MENKNVWNHQPVTVNTHEISINDYISVLDYEINPHYL
jgi:hypothetical protein